MKQKTLRTILDSQVHQRAIPEIEQNHLLDQNLQEHIRLGARTSMDIRMIREALELLADKKESIHR